MDVIFPTLMALKRTDTIARIQAQIVHYACREHVCQIYASFTKVRFVEIDRRISCMQRCFIRPPVFYHIFFVKCTKQRIIIIMYLLMDSLIKSDSC